MTKIKTSSTVKGRPGFTVKGTAGALTGRRMVDVTKVAVDGVKRKFARNPAAANSLIGTKKDVNPDSQFNTVAQQHPRIIRDPKHGAPQTGQEKVVDRSTNRRVRKLK